MTKEDIKKIINKSVIAKSIRFIKYNRYWALTIRALFLSAYYRICILLVHPQKLHKYWGIEGEESPMTESKENLIYAWKVRYAVERVCTRTTWESKCLVRALTAQHLLKSKHISSTLYLGCKVEDEKMLAHAWIRCGELAVTGGNGKDYSIVQRFSHTYSSKT